ncbi:Anaphase-promoting complex subunit 10 [Sphaerulina musiva]
MPPTTLRSRRGVSNVGRRPTSTTSDEEELPEGNLDDENTAESGAADHEGDEDELPEISSLASWTVSTAKPGNGVLALRSADVAQFWQSDGPQPHLLSIHFFKLVSIVRMRIYLDYLSDESYTPTKIQFLAGMGVHDLLEFAEMSFEQPTGWIDVDFTKVGPPRGHHHQPFTTAHGNGGSEDDDDEDDELSPPVLRAFLVQVRILENHQNGKDTHLRAVQLFARDDASQPAAAAAKPAVHHVKSPAAATATVTDAMMQQPRKKKSRAPPKNWIGMMDPDIR